MAQEAHNLFNTLQEFQVPDGQRGYLYALPQLERSGVGQVSRLPVCLRIVLESVLRNYDGKRIAEADVRRLASWQPNAERTAEIPFVVARILLHDTTGVPLLVDLAAMRAAVARMGRDPALVEPLVPVDLVVDHSVQIDYSRTETALQRNMAIELRRNHERYRFLKWGTQAFERLTVIPPGTGIMHQINMEYLAHGLIESQGVCYPDSLVGADSHTTMINGLGVVGWGVGGIEAEAGMLGQPIAFLTPDVVGVELRGALQPGVTITDLVLRVTELLRQAKVVGALVEFHGAGAASLSTTDRATIANMAPEYGATMGFFPPDEETCRYFLATGRSTAQVARYRAYLEAQGLFGMPEADEIQYSRLLELDLATVVPSVAGPKRPQDRIDLPELKARFREIFQQPISANGYGKALTELGQRAVVPVDVERAALIGSTLVGGGAQDADRMPSGGALTNAQNTATTTEIEMLQNRPTPDLLEAGPGVTFPAGRVALGHGDVVIAAITSCTNTANPSVMLAAGLLAKKAVERGLTVRPEVKTSLAPGSRVVTEYLTRTGLQAYLDALGFQTAGYGCTTCIGNSGPLHPAVDAAIRDHDLVVASVLSGNRNFEARIHQSVRANFLMSPPLVIAFAIAGRVDIDLSREPLGRDREGNDVFLRDIWPSPAEIATAMEAADNPAAYQQLYRDLAGQNAAWVAIPASEGALYAWEPQSTYLQEPPYFDQELMQSIGGGAIKGARALAIFGDSVTTDHISPVGAIKPGSPAGLYLQAQGVTPAEFNSYGARRGNHQVMVRGAFANIRIKNLMVPEVEGGVTIHQPSGERMSVYDAALRYQASGTPLVVLAGHEYGTGSSRDWAAKGTRLLGVRAVIAQSFERIHRSNLVGMGVLPCQFAAGVSAQSLGLDGTEQFDLVGLEGEVTPNMKVGLRIHRADGTKEETELTLRLDTPIEVEYYRHGGILPHVLAQLLRTDWEESQKEPA